MSSLPLEPRYPRLLRRVRGFLIDGVLLIAVVYTWILCVPLLGDSSILVKMLALVLPVLMLEPVLVAFTGGTIGHHIMGLRIRRASSDENIGILRATLRAVVRSLLGWFSFIFVLVTRKHQAVHDYFTGSVVILRHPESLPEHEKLEPRVEERAQYLYPSGLRRVAVIVCYATFVFVALSLLSAMLLTEECSMENHCTELEELAVGVLGLVMFFSIGAVIVLGWRGLLYGCRRSKASVEGANLDHTFFRDR